MPTGFFIEVDNGSDEIVVGSVADQFEGIIQHNVRTARTPNAVLSECVLVGLLAPVTEPLSEYFVVFVGNVVLRPQPMRLDSLSRVGHLKHIFRIAETTGHGEQREQDPLVVLSRLQIPVERRRALRVRTKRTNRGKVHLDRRPPANPLHFVADRHP